MLKFGQMLTGGGKYPGGQMLKPETIEMMTAKQTPEGIHECYGLGFYAEEHQYGHWGAFHAGTFIYRNMDLITIWQFHCLFPGESEAARKTSEDAAFKVLEAARK